MSYSSLVVEEVFFKMHQIASLLRPLRSKMDATSRSTLCAVLRVVDYYSNNINDRSLIRHEIESLFNEATNICPYHSKLSPDDICYGSDVCLDCPACRFIPGPSHEEVFEYGV